MSVVKNYYHPIQRIFTKEYGWIGMDKLYQKYTRKRDFINILEYDMDNNEFFYNADFEMELAHVRSCTNLFGGEVGSMVQFNVHQDCEVMVSLDGGETLEFKTARELHKLDRTGESILHLNLQSLYDMYTGSDSLRMFSGVKKTNWRYNSGLAYGITTKMGYAISRYNGRVSVLGSLTEK